MNELLISEDFYSIQGEGISSGYPSYFIRLANCNLCCGTSFKHLNEIRKGNYEPGNFKGDLHQQNLATWTCDTIPVWIKGEKRPFSYLIDRWKEQGLFEHIRDEIIRLIWTGGEPLLQQQGIVDFNHFFAEQTSTYPYNEIETNGTVYINTELFPLIDQINCSPKLKNSGNDTRLRYKTDALERITQHSNYQFKFVISEEKDMEEIFNDYINPLNIPLTNVVIMPGLDDQRDFHERTRFVLETAKKYKVIGLTRLHVSAWNKTTGV